MGEKKILLVGYMASGKSSVGQLLAKRLQINYADLDQLIEKNNEQSVAEIFKNKGEIFFRKQEHQILHQIIATPDAMILSLGGGTPCYANNHLVFQREDVVSVYLKANVSTLVNRIAADISIRPLLQNIDDLPSYVGQHLLERSFYYNQAQFSVRTDNKSIESIVDEIIALL